MHLTDVAVRRQLFLDVLDGTKALVSTPGSFPFLRSHRELTVWQSISDEVAQEVRLSGKEVPRLLAPGRAQD